MIEPRKEKEARERQTMLRKGLQGVLPRSSGDLGGGKAEVSRMKKATKRSLDDSEAAHEPRRKRKACSRGQEQKKESGKDTKKVQEKVTSLVDPVAGAEKLSLQDRTELGELLSVSTNTGTKEMYMRAELSLRELYPDLWTHPSFVLKAILDQKREGRSPATMTQALCLRRLMHVEPNVANDPLVIRAMEAYREYWKRYKRHSRPPIDWKMLQDALRYIKESEMVKDFAQVKYCLELAYCFGLRISEALRQDIAEIHTDGEVAMLCIREWKTKKTPKPSFRLAADPLADAICRKIKQKWGHRGCIAQGELTLTEAFVNKVLKKAAEHLQWEAPAGCFAAFTSHGFRHGRTVGLLKAGVEEAKVCKSLDMSVKNLRTYGIH